MRRVTIKEAASVLGVDEEQIKAQVTAGQLVACQELQYQGYVWLKDTVDTPPRRKATGKSTRVKALPEPSKASKEEQPLTETSEPASPQKAPAKAEEKERRPRTSQRAQEVQLLQETVAMLKEELKAKDRQLTLKDAEIQARREEVKGLLEMLNQNRALPAPEVSSALTASTATAQRPTTPENPLSRLAKVLFPFARKRNKVGGGEAGTSSS